MERMEKVLSYWFAGIADETILSKDSEPVEKWFKKSQEVDYDISRQFEGTLIGARKGKYDSWLKTSQGRLALIILFDQFSRNIYRNTPKAFENDLKALEYCLLSVKDGFDEKLRLIERQFLYMPFMHCENLKIQEKSLEYFGDLAQASQGNDSKNFPYFQYVLDFARMHYEIIKRFGRFPHRNVILGRRSTTEETEFLKEPNSSF